MALIANIDGPTRRIFLDISTVGATVNPIDIYKEMRTLRASTEELRKYDVFLSAFGNVSKGGGKFTERYVRENAGTRIVPYDTSQELTISGTIITDDGQEGVACFDRSPLTATTIVDINYVPPQVEVVRAEAELKAIVQTAYGDSVCIDEINGYAGTGTNVNNDYIGTRVAPSNNQSEAMTIAVNKGLYALKAIGIVNLTGIKSLNNYKLIGDNPSQSRFVFNSADTGDLAIHDARFSGSMNGALHARNCIIDNITGVGCTTSPLMLAGCFFTSTLVMRADNNQTINLINCGSLENNIFILDVNGTVGNITILGYTDRIKIINMTSAISLHVTGNGCELILDVSCTAGNIELHGDIVFINNSVITSIADNTNNKLLNHIERAVWIDTERLVTGEGTQSSPFNNLTTAIDYAESLGLNRLYIYADIQLDRSLKNFIIHGIGTPTIDCNGQNLTKSEFAHCKMQGTYVGAIIVQECVLLNGFLLNGFFEKNGLAGDLVCADATQVFMTGNGSTIAGLGRPTISLNATGSAKLSIRDNNGGITIKDCNNILDEVTVEINKGSLTFDNTNDLKFDGQMVARGDGKFVDNTTGFNVTNEMQSKITWQEIVEANFTAEEMLRLIASMAAAKASGMENNAPIFRDINDTKNRISATTDNNGNRLSVTLDAT